MDQELIAYLDERFRETTHQIAGLQQQTADLQQETAGLRQETGGLRQQLEAFRQETAERFGQVDDAIRHTQITAEGLRSDLRQVAEGVMGVSERLESLGVDVARGFDGVGQRIAPFYNDLERRLNFLEGWAERKDQDAIEVIRKKFGPPRAQ